MHLSWIWIYWNCWKRQKLKLETQERLRWWRLLTLNSRTIFRTRVNVLCLWGCLAPGQQIVMKRNWQMQSLNVRTKSVLIAHKCLKQKILGEKSLRQFVGLDSWTFFCTAAWEGIGILNEESSEVIN